MRKAAAPDQSRPARHREGSPRLDEPPDLAAGRAPPDDQARAQDARLGTSGSARRRIGRTAKATTRSPGAAGGTSAPARSATWPATPATCRSWRWTCAIPSSVEAECPEHDGDSYPNARRSSSSSRSWTAAQRSRCTGTTAATCRRASCSTASRSKTKDEDGKDVPPPYKSGCLIDRRQGQDVRRRRLCRAGHPDRRRRRRSSTSSIRQPRPREGMVHRHAATRSKPAMSNFPDYAGPLTETILLGNLAVWKRGRVEWDPKNLKPLTTRRWRRSSTANTATATKCNDGSV